MQTSRLPWTMPRPMSTLSLLTFLTQPLAGKIRCLRYCLLATNPTHSSQVTSRESSQTPNLFFLTIQSFQIGGKRRRQAASFVDYKGRSTSNCLQATTYTLFAGRLFAQYANGTTAQFSAFSGDLSTILEPRTLVGDIDTEFSISSTGSLLWNNADFFNGAAQFCILPSGDLMAIFSQGAQPESCVFVDLTVALC